MEQERECVRRFLDGDKSAFVEVVALYRDGLLYFVNGFVGCVAESEDIVSDVFCELLLHKGRFGRNSSLKTYLYAIGRNKALNYLKKRSRLSDTPLCDLENELADASELEEAVIGDERKRLLHNALSRLGDDRRTALHLVYFERLTCREAAEVMRRTNKQVERLVASARAELRTILEGEGFNYENL